MTKKKKIKHEPLLTGPAMSERARIVLESELRDARRIAEIPPPIPCPKLSYVSEDAANAARERLVDLRGEEDSWLLMSYRCRRCWRWHHGNSSL